MNQHARTLRLMSQQIEWHTAGKIPLSKLVSELEAAAQLLSSFDSAWLRQFHEHWAALEEVNAVLLDREQREPSDDLRDVVNAAKVGIAALVQSRLGSSDLAYPRLKLIASPTRISDEEVRAFAQRHGVKLPASYASFLLLNNGGQPVPSFFPIAGFEGNPYGNIQAFFGLNASIATEDLDRTLAELGSRIPQDILPIACTGTDDFLVIDLRRPGAPVLFWDRKRFWGSGVWDENDLYAVADDFGALLAGLSNGDVEPE